MSELEQVGQDPRRLVVGTAGHVDHGKTSLVRALTGVDCDRWEEEKRRGITIDLGFAHRLEHLADGGELQIGFVDVPGHERFVHNALAGLGGIDLMMLVVAADEGVKPQTREHLAICELLEIPAGVVALTKCDLVDAELLELACLELEEALQGTVFEKAPIVPVSSTTGAGLEVLVETLVSLQSRASRASLRRGRPLRLPVDRAFQLQGLGVLVTGTVHDGSVQVGDSVLIEPGAHTARVRSAQVHGQDRATVQCGERASLQLVGVGLQEVARGDMVVSGAPGIVGGSTTTRRLCVRFRLLPGAPDHVEVSRSKPLEVRFHLFSSDRMAKLRLLPVGGTPGEGAVAKAGDEAIAEVLLDKAVVAVRGDRFVLRRPSPRTTLGGGEVLDPRWRPGRGAAQSLALAVAGSDEDALLGWARQGSDAGVDAAQIAARLGCPEEEAGAHLGRLAAEHKLIEVQTAGRPTRWLAPAMVQAVGSRARALVEEFFAKDRLSPGMPKATLLSALLAPDTQALLGETYLKWFVAQKLLEVRGDRVAVPGRAGMSTGETDLAAKIVAAFQEQGLTPGSPQEICRQVGAKPQLFEGLLKHLVSSGQMVRLPDGLFLSRAALDRLEQDVSNQGWERFTVPEFKDHFGLSRKWAIPLLEYLDRRAITRREGDVRVLRR